MSKSEPQCPCEGRTLEKFIRPAVLIALAEGDKSGYSIVSRLSEMPVQDGKKPNAAGVYRALNSMEEEGLLTSNWEISSSGPAKKVYHLSDHGKDCLCTWLFTLNGYKQAIDDLLTLGRSIVDSWS